MAIASPPAQPNLSTKFRAYLSETGVTGDRAEQLARKFDLYLAQRASTTQADATPSPYDKFQVPAGNPLVSAGINNAARPNAFADPQIDPNDYSPEIEQAAKSITPQEIADLRAYAKASGGNLDGQQDSDVALVAARMKLQPGGVMQRRGPTVTPQGSGVPASSPLGQMARAIPGVKQARDFAYGAAQGGISQPGSGIASMMGTGLGVAGFDNAAALFHEAANQINAQAPQGSGVPFKLGTVAGQMAPALSATVTGGATTPLVTSLLSASSFGSGVQEYRNTLLSRGEQPTPGGELAVGLGFAAVEYITERIGIDAAVRKVPGLGNSLKAFRTNPTPAAAMQFVNDMAPVMLANTGEELSAQGGQNLIAKAKYDPNRPITQGMVEAGLLGAAGGAMIAAPGAALNALGAGFNAYDARQRAQQKAQQPRQAPESGGAGGTQNTPVDTPQTPPNTTALDEAAAMAEDRLNERYRTQPSAPIPAPVGSPSPADQVASSRPEQDAGADVATASVLRDLGIDPAAFSARVEQARVDQYRNNPQQAYLDGKITREQLVAFLEERVANDPGEQLRRQAEARATGPQREMRRVDRPMTPRVTLDPNAQVPEQQPRRFTDRLTVPQRAPSAATPSTPTSERPASGPQAGGRTATGTAPGAGTSPSPVLPGAQPPASSGPTVSQTGPVVGAGTSASPQSTREPWQMTRGEYKQNKGVNERDFKRGMWDKIHSNAVHEAHAAGKPVPPEVLAEYGLKPNPSESPNSSNPPAKPDGSTQPQGQAAATTNKENANGEEEAPQAQVLNEERSRLLDAIVKQENNTREAQGRFKIEEQAQLKGTDGNWYFPNGFPIGVRSTGERRVRGYSVGSQSFQTREQAEKYVADRKAGDDIRADLADSSIEELRRILGDTGTAAPAPAQGTGAVSAEPFTRTDGTAKEAGTKRVEELRATFKTKRAGWHFAETDEGATLIHPTEDRVVRFKADQSNQRDRARTYAQAFADDNPVKTEQTAPGELKVQELKIGGEQPDDGVRVADKLAKTMTEQHAQNGYTTGVKGFGEKYAQLTDEQRRDLVKELVRRKLLPPVYAKMRKMSFTGFQIENHIANRLKELASDAKANREAFTESAGYKLAMGEQDASTAATAPQPAPAKVEGKKAVQAVADDIPNDVAERAFSGTSHVPETRARAWKTYYVNDFNNLAEKFRKLADTDELRAAVEEELTRFREGLQAKYLAYLGAHSRVMSSMITGPARFPVEANRKRMESADKRLAEIVEFVKRADKSITKRLFPQASGVIRSDDANAPDALRAAIEARQRRQEAMKEANKIVRKGGDKAAMVTALEGLGFSNEEARHVIYPKFQRGMGFPGYALNNNNKEIRRLQERLATLEAQRAREPRTATFPGGKVVENAEMQRVQILYDDKPDEATREKLSSRGFRWAPSQRANQRLMNESAWRAALQITGATEDQKAPAQTENTDEIDAAEVAAEVERRKQADAATIPQEQTDGTDAAVEEAPAVPPKQIAKSQIIDLLEPKLPDGAWSNARAQNTVRRDELGKKTRDQLLKMLEDRTKIRQDIEATKPLMDAWYASLTQTAESAGSSWQSALKAVAEKHGVSMPPPATRGEMAASLASKLAQKGVDAPKLTPQEPQDAAEAQAPAPQPDGQPQQADGGEADAAPEAAPAEEVKQPTPPPAPPKQAKPLVVHTLKTAPSPTGRVAISSLNLREGNNAEAAVDALNRWYKERTEFEETSGPKAERKWKAAHEGRNPLEETISDADMKIVTDAWNILMESAQSFDAGPNATFFARPGKEAAVKKLADKAAKIKGAEAPDKPDGPGSVKFPAGAPGAKVSRVKTPADAVASVYVAAARDNSRYSINGVFVAAKGKKSEIVATDGRRAWIVTVPADQAPKPGLYTPLDNPNIEKGVVIRTSEGTFPPYADIIPKQVAKENAVARFNAVAAANAVRRAALMMTEENWGVLVVVNTDGSLGFASRDPQTGTIEINVREGFKEMGSVNAVYLAEALDFAVKHGDEKVELWWERPNKPIAIRGTNGGTLTVTMPINGEGMSIDHVRAVGSGTNLKDDINTVVRMMNHDYESAGTYPMQLIQIAGDKKLVQKYLNNKTPALANALKTRLIELRDVKHGGTGGASPGTAFRTPPTINDRAAAALMDWSGRARKRFDDYMGKMQRGEILGSGAPLTPLIDLAAHVAFKALASGITSKSGRKLTAFIEGRMADIRAKWPDLNVTTATLRRQVRNMLAAANDDKEQIIPAYAAARERVERQRTRATGKESGKPAEVREAVASAAAERPDIASKIIDAVRRGIKQGRAEGMRTASDALKPLIRQARDAAKRARQIADIEARGASDKATNAAADQAATEKGIRAEAVRLVQETPIAGRRKYLKSVANAADMRDLAKILRRLRGDLAKETGRHFALRAERLADGFKKLDENRLNAARKLLREVRQMYAELKDKDTGVDQREELANSIQDSFETLNSIIHEQRNADKVFRQGRAIVLSEHREQMMDAITKQAELPKPENSKEDREPTWFRQKIRKYADFRTLMQILDRVYDETGIFSRARRAMEARRTAELAKNQEFIDKAEAIVKANGYKSWSDFMARTEGAMGDAGTEWVKIDLGGVDRLTVGQAMALYAQDIETKELMHAGQPWRLNRNGDQFVIDDYKLAELESKLTDGQKRIAKQINALRSDMQFDRADAVYKRITGNHMVKVEGHYPRKRILDKSGSEDTIDIAKISMGEWAVQSLENSGFTIKRVQDKKTPLLLEDFGSTQVRSFQGTEMMIQRAEMVKYLKATLFQRDISDAIAQRYGGAMMKRLTQVVAEYSGNSAPESDKFLRKVAAGTARSMTQVNPGTWLRNLSTVFRLPLAMIDGKMVGASAVLSAIPKALLHWRSTLKILMQHSPDLRHRWSHAGAAISMMPTGATTDVDSHFADATKATVRQVLYAAKAWSKPRNAAGRLGEVSKGWGQLLDSIKVGNAFDAFAAVVAYHAMRAKAPEGLSPNAGDKWAARKAADAFMQTANTNDLLNANEWQTDAKRNTGAALILTFTSDIAKMQNLLFLANKRGGKARALAVGAVAASMVWSVAVRYALASLLGDDDEKKDQEAINTVREELVSLLPGGTNLWNPLLDTMTRGGRTRLSVLDTPLTSIVRHGEALVNEIRKEDGDPLEVAYRASRVFLDPVGNPLAPISGMVRRAVKNYAE